MKKRLNIRTGVSKNTSRDYGFRLSVIPICGELFINAALQSNLDKTLHAIAKIGKLTNT
jgi:hypothetical protein